ncbi:unnamed protein product [Dracunculus medinensis]|uniref:Phospholipase n=1 Tax=Dracunculus medinensis TaxID=318479 RepID=A0A0N4U8H5_DRAME|nr:unnamed protein product [Dracunculus medinensis]
MDPFETNVQSSPVKVLQLANDIFFVNGRKPARKLLILAHEGNSSDLVAETIETRFSL